MICVEHLTKRYGNHTAVDDLSFEVLDGQIYGLLGPNGAGKSTTMNIITGYSCATAGTVTIDGHDIQEEPQAAKAALGYLPEQPPLYQDMTVQEYLLFAAQLKGRRDKKARRDEVNAVMERTDILSMSGRLIRNLSKGYRQRVGLAAALLGDPKVIILDEPTVGLDPAQVIEIRNLIRALGKEHTVILSSHILSEVQAVCDHVLILAHGKLAAQGTPEQLAARLAAPNILHVTALGNAEVVLQAARGVQGLSQITLLGEKNGEVSFSANSEADKDLRAALSDALGRASCPVLAMGSQSASLEDVFLQLTGEEPTEEPTDAAEAAGEPGTAEEAAQEKDAPVPQSAETGEEEQTNDSDM